MTSLGPNQQLNHIGPLATQELQLLKVHPTNPIISNTQPPIIGQPNAGNPPARAVHSTSLLLPSLVNALTSSSTYIISNSKFSLG